MLWSKHIMTAANLKKDSSIRTVNLPKYLKEKTVNAYLPTHSKNSKSNYHMSVFFKRWHNGAMFSIFISLVFQFFMNRISGVMVRVLNSIEVDSVFEPRSCQSNDYKIGICCFSTKHAALRKKSKDWLSRNQDNVFECGDMSIQINVQQNIYMNF